MHQNGRIELNVTVSVAYLVLVAVYIFQCQFMAESEEKGKKERKKFRVGLLKAVSRHVIFVHQTRHTETFWS